MNTTADQEMDVVSPNSKSVNSDSKKSGTDKVEAPQSILPTDPVVCTAGYDHTIKFWGVHTGLCLKTFQHKDSQVNALCITPDRRVVAAAGFQKIRMYDIYSCSANPALDFGFSKNVTTIGFNKDGQWMYSGGEDCKARIWDLRSSSRRCEKVFQAKFSPSPITCATLHPNNAQLILTDQNGKILVWDLRTDKAGQLTPDVVPHSGTLPASIQSVAMDPLGKFLAVVNVKGDCYVWKLRGTELDVEPLRLNLHHKMKAHERYGLKCVFSPDSSLLATTSADQTAKIWSVKNEQFNLKSELSVPRGQKWVWDAAFTGDSKYIFTSSSDMVARLWCLGNGRLKKEYIGHERSVTCVTFRDPSM